MDLPTSSTDIRIAFACRVCSGNGGLGPRTAIRNSDGTSTRFNACTTCNGSGWTLKKPGELNPEELRKLLTKLPKI